MQTKHPDTCDASCIVPAANAGTTLPIQAKLTVGAVDDPLEHEADAMADKVMNMQTIPSVSAASGNSVQRKCAECEKDDDEEMIQRKPLASFIQRKESGSGAAAGNTISNQIGASRGNGNSMDGATKSFMESRFGTDFSNVRVHTSNEAAEMNRELSARAFTVGNDIYFNEREYQPNSEDGKHLLAHELTHTIQQGNTTIGASSIQRSLTCDITHITTECGSAAGTCSAIQSTYCGKKYPDAASISTLHTNAVAGAKSESKDIPEAASNLLYFLGGKGGDKLMPTDIFKNHKATKDQLTNVHRKKFIEGVQKRLADGRLKAGGTATMEWTDTANAFDFTKTDLGLAVGGYTLCSNVTVSTKDLGSGKIELSFDKWSVQAFDCYNWDPGKGIGGMFGGVSDNDLCCLENAGKAQHFQIHTDPWKNTHAPSLGKETISAGAPATTTAPAKDKSGDR